MIQDYACTFDNAIGIHPEITEKLGLEFPQAYEKTETMMRIAVAIKEYENNPFCELPFCHTLEGEALGGIINMGSAEVGPRAKAYVCENLDDVLNLKNIDFGSGRIAEVLSACKALKDSGETVVLDISGPFTILNVLIDPKHVYKGMRKTPDKMQAIFDKLSLELLDFVDHALTAGVDVISYADSSAGVNILGPKMSEQVVEMFTLPLVKAIEEKVQLKALVHLCPKTANALIGTNTAKWEPYPVTDNASYTAALSGLKGSVQFVGETCIKNRKYTVKNGEIKKMVLI